MNYPTIEKFKQYLQHETDAGPHSISLYVKEIEKFLRWLHDERTPRTDKRLLDVTGRKVEDYFAFLHKKGISKNARRSYIKTAINQFYKFARAKGLISLPLDYTLTYPELEEKKHAKEFRLSETEIQAIREYVREMPLHFETPTEQYRKFEKIVLVEMLIQTGARISEVVNLTKDDILAHKHRIAFNGKRGYRETPISKNSNLFELVEQLTKMYLYTFSKSSDKIFHIGDFGCRKFCRKVGRELGFHLYPHLFRHYRATQLYKTELKEKFIAKIMGMSIKTLQSVYAHVTDDIAQEQFDAVGI